MIRVYNHVYTLDMNQTTLLEPERARILRLAERLGSRKAAADQIALNGELSEALVRKVIYQPGANITVATLATLRARLDQIEDSIIRESAA